MKENEIELKKAQTNSAEEKPINVSKPPRWKYKRGCKTCGKTNWKPNSHE